MKMKKLICSFTLLLCMTMSLVSCSKDDDPVPDGVDMDFVTFVNNSNQDVSVVVDYTMPFEFPTQAEFSRGDFAIQVVNANQSRMIEDAAAKSVIKAGGQVCIFAVNTAILKEYGADVVRANTSLYSSLILDSQPTDWTVTYPF